MDNKRTVIIVSAIIALLLLGAISGLAIWLNVTPIVEYDYSELEYVNICYFNKETNVYEKINIEEQEEMKRIYDTVKEAKLERVNRFPDDVLGGDSKWSVTLGFEDKKTVSYDADPELKSHYEYGCRRYRMDEKEPGMPKAMIIISSKELYDLMDEYIPE
ncbi:MAG: hypothetical protein IKY53_07260 [Lachnospiraceae bacterium]|nr:hypothetical protein [Lachnospiraceae bacterium]